MISGKLIVGSTSAAIKLTTKNWATEAVDQSTHSIDIVTYCDLVTPYGAKIDSGNGLFPEAKRHQWTSVDMS